MATTAFKGTPIHTIGDLPAIGSSAPDFTLAGSDLADFPRPEGTRLVLNIFPSIDTGVCSNSVRRFNELAAGLENTTVLCVSKDLPFALARFCGAEGIENVTVGSAFRSSFGEDYGVTLTDSGMRGLLGRSVVVVGADGKVIYTELVDDASHEPNYDAAVAALA